MTTGLARMSLSSRSFAACLVLLGAAGCTALTSDAAGVDPTVASPPAAAGEGDAPATSSDPPSAAPSNPPPASAPPPERPAPQSTIRSCGVAKTVANPLTTHVEWGTFSKTALGSSVVTAAPLATGAKTVSGTATRLTTATTANGSSGADADPDQALFFLGFLGPTELGPSALSNFTGPGGAPKSWYVAPTKTMLTYLRASSQHEVGWSIGSPKRTSVAAASSDRFVRGFSAGTYFGVEMALSFPSECAVGALSDALGRAALVHDAFPNTGIFAPGKTSDVQAVLVANDVKMFVRVTSNKRIAAVETLLASTTCSPAHIDACASLLTALDNAYKSVLSTIGSSDVVKLQSDTDPGWSPIVVATAPISIATP
jgi:hypothetical protein